MSSNHVHLQAHIMNMPEDILATDLGQMLAPMLAPLDRQLSKVVQQPAGISNVTSSLFSDSRSQLAAAPV